MERLCFEPSTAYRITKWHGIWGIKIHPICHFLLVVDVVSSPRKVKLVTPICLEQSTIYHTTSCCGPLIDLVKDLTAETQHMQTAVPYSSSMQLHASVAANPLRSATYAEANQIATRMPGHCSGLGLYCLRSNRPTYLRLPLTAAKV